MPPGDSDLAASGMSLDKRKPGTLPNGAAVTVKIIRKKTNGELK
jgi:hypothetical protein